MDLARKIAKVPFSVVFHFPPSLVPHRYDEFRRWRFHKDAEHLIGVSQATAREVELWAGRSCDVISHAVDTELFKPDAAIRARTRLELRVPTGAPVLVSVAALEERKGMQWVIQALPGILEEYNDTRYWIVGDGPYRASLEEQIRALGLQEHVFLAGFQKDVKPYLAASDVALLLSHGEAYSVSLLESAAMGLPIITSCHEPFPEIVRPEWGEMVDEKDRMVLVRKIIDLLSGPDLREYKGKQARAWVKSQHSWAQVAGQYRDLVEAIK
jgi:glycosyltransferase involved in cell wall biosynthesis